MADQIADISLRKTAIIAGFGYLTIFITGIFSIFLLSRVLSFLEMLQQQQIILLETICFFA